MMDLMILKLTEYNIVAFLKYDQIYEGLRKQFGGGVSNKLKEMDGGILYCIFPNTYRSFT